MLRRLAAMAESAPVTVVISLLSGTKVAEFVVPRSDTVLDVKTRLLDVEGTPIRKQQLVLNCDILRDETRISEITSADAVEFRLVRKEGFQFHWQAPHGKGASSSPEWSLETGEAISTKACTLGLRFYPSGFESKMHREGNFSVHVKRPKNSILLARVDVAGIRRERLFTSGHGTEEGWVNFAPRSHLPTTDPLDICLEVLHCAVVSAPTSEGSRISWDLRETLGRMPYAMGVPFVEEVRATSDEGTEIQLMVTFFPGGHTSAPRDHVSLWVSPLRGLEDRRYACVVDGSPEQRGSGESILHFPRVEVFGEIGIVICRSPSPDAPRRLRRFSDREYPGREPEAA